MPITEKTENKSGSFLTSAREAENMQIASSIKSQGKLARIITPVISKNPKSRSKSKTKTKNEKSSNFSEEYLKLLWVSHL